MTPASRRKADIREVNSASTYMVEPFDEKNYWLGPLRVKKAGHSEQNTASQITKLADSRWDCFAQFVRYQQIPDMQMSHNISKGLATVVIGVVNLCNSSHVAHILCAQCPTPCISTYFPTSRVRPVRIQQKNP